MSKIKLIFILMFAGVDFVSADPHLMARDVIYDKKVAAWPSRIMVTKEAQVLLSEGGSAKKIGNMDLVPVSMEMKVTSLTVALNSGSSSDLVIWRKSTSVPVLGALHVDNPYEIMFYDIVRKDGLIAILYSDTALRLDVVEVGVSGWRVTETFLIKDGIRVGERIEGAALAWLAEIHIVYQIEGSGQDQYSVIDLKSLSK